MEVELIDWMGSDVSVVDAARVSFSKTSQNYTQEQNSNLIKYLASHRHEMPFAHPHITFRCKAPIPIRTQCFKSKIGFVENEESRRYISSAPEVHVPEFFRSKPKGSIKQGSGERHKNSNEWLERYTNTCSKAVNEYIEMVEDGICPEQARFILPQGVNVNWVWTGSLLAYSRFFKLRTDPHAQEEIQMLATNIGDHIKELFPVSWSALVDA